MYFAAVGEYLVTFWLSPNHRWPAQAPGRICEAAP